MQGARLLVCVDKFKGTLSLKYNWYLIDDKIRILISILWFKCRGLVCWCVWTSSRARWVPRTWLRRCAAASDGAALRSATLWRCRTEATDFWVLWRRWLCSEKRLCCCPRATLHTTQKRSNLLFLFLILFCFVLLWRDCAAWLLVTLHTTQKRSTLVVVSGVLVSHFVLLCFVLLCFAFAFVWRDCAAALVPPRTPLFVLLLLFCAEFCAALLPCLSADHAKTVNSCSLFVFVFCLVCFGSSVCLCFVLLFSFPFQHVCRLRWILASEWTLVEALRWWSLHWPADSHNCPKHRELRRKTALRRSENCCEKWEKSVDPNSKKWLSDWADPPPTTEEQELCEHSEQTSQYPEKKRRTKVKQQRKV